MQTQLKAGVLSWLLVVACIVLVIGFAGDGLKAREARQPTAGSSPTDHNPTPSWSTPSHSPSVTPSAVPTSSTSHSPNPSHTSNRTTPPSTTPPPTSPSSSASPTGTPVASFPEVPADYVLPPITDGKVPVLTKVPTQQKVVFLTIDDGANKTQQEIDLLRTHKIKASLFLAQLFIVNNPGYFTGFLADGSKIENHSISHPLDLIHWPFGLQKQEICRMSDYEEQQYNRRPVFFRPPGGPYTQSLRKAAAQCGIKAIVDWSVEVRNGTVNYQEGNSLQPGDIVLMHFRKEFPQDLQAFLTAQKASGLKVVLLQDFLGMP